MTKVVFRLVKSISCNDVHPLKREFISVNSDESKWLKSIDIMFSTRGSYAESKKWAKLVIGEKKLMNISPPFILKALFAPKDSASIFTKDILLL